MVVNGSLSKTAVNGSAGAHTQLSGLLVAAMTVVTLLFLTALFEDLPEATLAAVVIAALIELVDIRALVAFYRLYSRRLGRIYGHAARPDFIAAVAAMFGVLVFDTLPGLFIGIAVSLVLLLYRASKPHVAELGLVPGTEDQFGDRDRHPENVMTPGVVIERVEGGLFFANADAVRDAVRADAARPGTRAVVLDAAAIAVRRHHRDPHARRARASSLRPDVQLAIAHDIGQVRDLLREAGGEDGTLAVYPTVRAAVDALAEP